MCCVVESLALGIDRWKVVIVDAIKKVLKEDGISIRGVYERSDAKVRLQEGMEQKQGIYRRALLTPRWRSWKMASATGGCGGWTEDRIFPRPEKQPAAIRSSLQRVKRCWTALPIRVPLP